MMKTKPNIICLVFASVSLALRFSFIGGIYFQECESLEAFEESSKRVAKDSLISLSALVDPSCSSLDVHWTCEPSLNIPNLKKVPVSSVLYSNIINKK